MLSGSHFRASLPAANSLSLGNDKGPAPRPPLAVFHSCPGHRDMAVVRGRSEEPMGHGKMNFLPLPSIFILTFAWFPQHAEITWISGAMTIHPQPPSPS